MSRLASLTRRYVLGGLGISLGTLWLPSCGGASEARGLGQGLLQLIDRPDRWRLVGERYLAGKPAKRRLKDLVAVLTESLGWNPEVGSRQDQASLLAAAVRRDFRSGRTVEVDGWVLSETEARLAAVAFLL